MIEIKPIIVAIVCFFTQEPFPVIGESTLLYIDFTLKEITIEHENLITAAAYVEMAKDALNQINKSNTLDASMGNISLVSKDFFEKDGRLNATIKVKFQELKDLEKIGFFVNPKGKLSYYKIDVMELLNENGIENEKEFIFEVDKTIAFKSTPKFTTPFEKVSLLSVWQENKN